MTVQLNSQTVKPLWYW